MKKKNRKMPMKALALILTLATCLAGPNPIERPRIGAWDGRYICTKSDFGMMQKKWVYDVRGGLMIEYLTTNDPESIYYYDLDFMPGNIVELSMKGPIRADSTQEQIDALQPSVIFMMDWERIPEGLKLTHKQSGVVVALAWEYKQI